MKQISYLLIILLTTIQLTAKEGMWIPIFLEGALMDDMKINGLKLSADDIYSVNNSSLKDAVVRFGGGCTAEIISGDGLLLTNHHCGYSMIQSHSSVEHDYLTDGFWAKTRADELSNPGLSVTFIVRIEDVTEKVLKEVSEARDSADLARIDSQIKEVVKQATADSHYEAFIKPIFEGNQYILFVTETYDDVRLVGAPPSSIGKFGFDTDNWVWPRHTGDFSIFRVYANKDNKPATYSEENVPFKPKYHLPISLKGYKEGDFTMVYGFPYKTEEYLSSYAVDHLINQSNPTKIQIRTKKLEVLNLAMREDDVVRIKYAAKQSSVSNAWKKWRGQLLGLKREKALQEKQDQEREMKSKIDLYPEKFGEYEGLLDKMAETYKEMNEVSLARDYFIEIGYYGTDILRLAYFLEPYVRKIESKKELEKEDKAKIASHLWTHFKDFDKVTDQAVFNAIFPMYLNSELNFYKPTILKEVAEDDKTSFGEWSEKLFDKTVLWDERKLTSMMAIEPEKGLKKLAKDPMYQLAASLISFYRTQINPAYGALNAEIENLNKQYFDALRDIYPDRVYYPDANGTLRLTFGEVKGMEPGDAVVYDYYTTIDGIAEKYVPESYEFEVPERLLELQRTRDYGDYAQDGELRVCFIASNHTSGGNSGSPVLNANGELIGLNFDRNWEGTMSDIEYDAGLCRNISVDIRYVLFVIDKFAEAGRLIEELTLIREQP